MNSKKTKYCKTVHFEIHLKVIMCVSMFFLKHNITYQTKAKNNSSY